MEFAGFLQQGNPEHCCPACTSNHIADRWPTERIQGDKMILWCADCGFGWQHPLPTAAEIRHYYDNSPTYNIHATGEKAVGFQRRIQRINQFTDNPGRLLDIGSGLGDFLSLATRNGWDAVGIEPQESAAQVCQQRFGIKPRVCIFDQIDFDPGVFDVVTLWDVWEHVHNHLDFIDRCISLLSPGGVLALSIPNASGYPARLFKGRWRYVMFTHLNYFTMPYVDNIMARRGMFKVWADHTFKIQSMLQGIEGCLPLKFKTEQIMRMGRKADATTSPGPRDGGLVRQKTTANSSLILNGIRRLVHKANLCPLPTTKGDMVDLFFTNKDKFSRNIPNPDE